MSSQKPFDALSKALRLTALGFTVIPLRRPERDRSGNLKRDAHGKEIDGKKPCISWRPYENRRPTESELKEWFNHGPRNLAIITGALSGVVVVDADSDEAVAWVTENLPHTPMRTRTQRGIHYFYRHPGGTVPNGVKLRGMPLDVRGDGGYVVAPGSLHASGFHYVEEGDWASLDAIPMMDPQWFSLPPPPESPAIVAPPRPVVPTERQTLLKRAKAYLEKMAPAIQGQGGDHQTFCACSVVLNDFGLSIEDSLDALGAWNARCAPPWSEKDLREKLNNAERYAKKPRGIRQMDDPPASSRSAPFPTVEREPEPGIPEPPSPTWIPEEEEPPAWKHLKKQYGPGGEKVRRWGGNLAKILRHDPRWGSRLTLNLMSQQVCFDGLPIPEHFADLVQEQIEDSYEASFSREELLNKVKAQATETPFHPVQEYLRGLPPWDGVDRLIHVAPEVLGATGPLAQHYVKHWAIGAVRRAMEPGCKHDYAVVLVGPQGRGKSSFWSVLAGTHFSDTPIDLDSKDRFQALASAWIVELPELDWMTSSKTAEAIKAFLTSREDCYRPPYAKEVLRVPRHSVCVGSTNKDRFLNDPTGNRRFWPIRIGESIDLELLRSWRDQFWAEARHCWEEREDHWLPQDMEILREDQSEEFQVEDPWLSMVQDAIAKLQEAALKKNRCLDEEGFTTAEVLTSMNIPAQHQTKGASARCVEQFRALGYSVKQNSVRGKKAYRWRPADKAA